MHCAIKTCFPFSGSAALSRNGMSSRPAPAGFLFFGTSLPIHFRYVTIACISLLVLSIGLPFRLLIIQSLTRNSIDSTLPLLFLNCGYIEATAEKLPPKDLAPASIWQFTQFIPLVIEAMFPFGPKNKDVF